MNERPANHILVIDDEDGIRFGICDFLESKGYKVAGAASCNEGERLFRESAPECIIMDYRLPDGNALDLIERIKALDQDVPIIVLTGHGSIELAVSAVRRGAEQFLTKPIELPALLLIVERILDNRRRKKKEIAIRYGRWKGRENPFLGNSPVIRELERKARKLLSFNRPILIQGETGSGKGVLARWLHENSPWSEEPFVDFNCAALSPDLLESELFGYEKGAFTGATSSKQGLFEVAHRGTVFLDEIGDMPLSVQPKLLKVLEEKQFRRLGSVQARRIDIRLITATHQNILERVAKSLFREDLFYRINTFPVTIPSLRDRVEDIRAIARKILSELGDEMGRDHLDLTPAAEKKLEGYSWPGNIRELRNLLERTILLNESSVIDSTDFEVSGFKSEVVLRQESLEFSGSPDPPDSTLLGAERRHIEHILQEERGQVSRAARRLGIPRSSLYHKIKKYGITLSK